MTSPIKPFYCRKPFTAFNVFVTKKTRQVIHCDIFISAIRHFETQNNGIQTFYDPLTICLNLFLSLNAKYITKSSFIYISIIFIILRKNKQLILISIFYWIL